MKNSGKDVNFLSIGYWRIYLRSILSANAGDGSPASGAGEAACGRTEPATGEDSRTLSGPGIGRSIAIEDPGAREEDRAADSKARGAVTRADQSETCAQQGTGRGAYHVHERPDVHLAASRLRDR